MTHTVFFRVMIPKWTKIPVIKYTENAPFLNRDYSSVIWGQVFSKVLLERGTLLEYDSVIKKPYCCQGVLKATFCPCAMTQKTGQYKWRLA